jgi:hypothetical protein
MLSFLIFGTLLVFTPFSNAWAVATMSSSLTTRLVRRNPTMSSLFTSDDSVPALKSQILQLGAALDRGQAYNPTSGSYYKDRMDLATQKV